MVRWLRLRALVVALVGVTAAGISSAVPARAASVPAYDHVFVIVMENHSYSEIIGSSSAPYTNSLLVSGALATNYFATAHPSLPNYLALTAGSTFGVTSDCTTCWLAVGSIADRVEAAGKTWKAYEESMPAACFVGDSYPYAQKHDPFIYYNNIRTNPSRCQSHVVPYSQLATDLLSTAATPSYSFITPNMCDDMHDCSVATGDSWLSHNVPAILNSPAFKFQHSLLALTWDEDDFSGTNQVATILVGSNVRANYRTAVTYGHYSLLHTVGAALGLPAVTSNDANAALMSDMFSTSTSTATPCTAASGAATPASPQQIGTTVQLTATASGCPHPEYEFWLRPASSTSWLLAQAYSPTATFSWSTAGSPGGQYLFSVWARDTSSTGVAGNTLGSWDAYTSLAYVVTSSSGVCTSVTATGTSASINATASGCSSPLYEFWMLPPGSQTWQLAQQYSSNATLNLGATPRPAGTYAFSVWARDASSGGLAGDSLGTWDSYATLTVTIGSAAAPCTSATVSASSSGSTATFVATATGCPNPTFEFWILPPGATTWLVAQAYSATGTYVFSAIGQSVGTYQLSIWARDASSAGLAGDSLGTWDAYTTGSVTVS